MSADPDRRQFVSSAVSTLGGALLWLQLPAAGALAACARDAARRGDSFTTFSAREGAAFRAVAGRILPAEDGLPGAEEAGAAWFADRALGGPLGELLPPVREGLADLDARARAAHSADFAALQPGQQDAVLRAAEDTPFFFLARLVTLAGVFSPAEHGGNRNQAADRILGVEHHAAYLPPFGWYDAEAARVAGGAA